MSYGKGSDLRGTSIGKQTKGTKTFGFQKQTRTKCWKIFIYEPTIAGAGAENPGMHDPSQNDQNDNGISLEGIF